MAALRAWAFLALVVAGCNQAPALSHFDSDGLAFDYPSTWNAATFDMSSSFQHRWVWLSTETMADPCDRVSSSEMISIDCERWPVASTLRENGVLLSWSSNGFPGWAFNANAGDSIRVDGLQATMEVNAADSDCMAIGGKAQIRVIVASNVPHNWTEMDGCVNGPFNGTVKDQVMAMLTSADLR